MTDPTRQVHERAELEETARRRVAAGARWREFAALPEAAGREKLAIGLADNSDISIEQARKVLRAAPIAAE